MIKLYKKSYQKVKEEYTQHLCFFVEKYNLHGFLYNF